MKEFEIALDIAQQLSEKTMHEAAARACGLPLSKVAHVKVLRRSLDARGGVKYRYRLAAYAAGEPLPLPRTFDYKNVASSEEVIVIGGGPAGMFAALELLQLGLKPVVLERGKDVHERKADVALLSRNMQLNPESNYCFGEGGAGTFSDGKLYTRSSKRGDIFKVLEQLVLFGADSSILVDAHPHIGSDRLPGIVENIRKCIVEHGGEYHFRARVCDLRPPVLSTDPWRVACADGSVYCAHKVLLATGHSARDIYELFAGRGWALEAKGFALGVRAEHPQSLINDIQYHGRRGSMLPPAEYSLVQQVGGRGVFSFCMCPGGVLVPSATEPGALVLNGMSASKRSSRWANAGIVVSVGPEDVPEYSRHGIFALLEFQKSVERAHYNFTGSFRAPAQRMTDFCRRKASSDLPRSSYPPGCVSAPLHEILPGFVAASLAEGFKLFDRKMRGYYTSEALLLGCESRTSSPVRVPRDPVTFCHVQLPGLYPCGEGAGYAGGIVSSALDGIAAAERCAAQRFAQ